MSQAAVTALARGVTQVQMHTLCMLKSECDLSIKGLGDGILVGVCSSSIGSTVSGGYQLEARGKGEGN